MSVNWPRFVELVRAHQRFLLTSHIRPDCDALGSELGMAGVLRSLGKETLIVNAHATPYNLKFIDPRGELKVLGASVTAEQIASCQVLLVLDTSAWAQLGGMADVLKAFQGVKAVLDHHVSQDDLGAELFKNTQAEATGSLVFEAARHLGVTLTPEIATPLFAAVATDTGWYRFSSTTGNTYRTAGALVDAGASPAGIYNALYEQDTLPRLQLLGRIMARAQAELSGKLIHTAVLREDFEATKAAPSDTEDAINMTLDVAGTQVAVILVEQPTGGFKISFRSRCHVDCSKLAETFGGGGHKAAAGAFIAGDFKAAQAKVLEAAREAMGT